MKASMGQGIPVQKEIEKSPGRAQEKGARVREQEKGKTVNATAEKRKVRGKGEVLEREVALLRRAVKVLAMELQQGAKERGEQVVCVKRFFL